MKRAFIRRPWTFIRMHEFFSRLSIASVDLSEVVFSALVGFSLSTGIWFPGRTLTPRTLHRWLWCSWSRGHCLWSPTSPVRLQHEVALTQLQSFRHFPYNGNPTRALKTTSLKCWLPSTDAIDRREKIHVCVWSFKVSSSKRASLKSIRFSQKKKPGIYSPPH